MRRRRAQPEAAIQRAVFDHIGWRKVAGWHFWATPNAAKRSLRMGAELKRQGMTAGVGDVSAISPSGQYYELEIKTMKGRLSSAQRERQELLRRSGCICEVAHGLDAALRCLLKWGAIR